MQNSIYLVGPRRQVLELFNPLWGETLLTPRRFESAESAIKDLRGGSRPKGVVISYPLLDATVDEVLQGIRDSDSNGFRVPTFIVAPEDAVAKVGLYEDLGVTVLSDAQDGTTLRRRVRDALFPERRAAQRLVVRMEVHLGSGKLLRLCQSENLSVSGMLIRTSERYPIGSTIAFEFVLPQDDEPIRGEAQVVRYTEPRVEKIQGVGTRFVSFEEDGQERLERFIVLGCNE